MENHLSLIKTDFQDLEKRIFPRFPFSYLTFKGQTGAVFAVKDISYTGMQLGLKNGGHNYKKGDELTGPLHWKGINLEVVGVVKWVSANSLGVAFSDSDAWEDKIRNFLSVDNIISGMCPVHQANLGIEMPANLKYWLQADGPVEVFVWCHNDGEIARFQVIMMGSFVEYEDGKGLKSGRVLTKRDLDTPLFQEDEFVFEMDQAMDEEKLSLAQEIICRIPQSFLPIEAKDFLKIKLQVKE